jgi:adenosylmethionine-8-amino-7-oxononanoate aminotransferase
MREVCDEYGVLLIFDEIMCGMGRTGYLHAWQKELVVPDIQLVGKGLAGGFSQISGMLVGHKVAEAFENGPSKGAFNHGHTFQCQAESCAAALATQSFIQDNHLLENVQKQGPILMRKVRERLQHHRNVGDIRGAEEGLFFGVSSRFPHRKQYLTLID